MSEGGGEGEEREKGGRGRERGGRREGEGREKEGRGLAETPHLRKARSGGK